MKAILEFSDYRQIDSILSLLIYHLQDAWKNKVPYLFKG